MKAWCAMDNDDVFARSTTQLSEYARSCELKNEGMVMSERSYPTIREYYQAVAKPTDDNRQITYQHGLSNYSSLQLGDERISFNKSLQKATYTMEAIGANDNISVLTDAHLRNSSKSSAAREADYNDAMEIVGEENVDLAEEEIRLKMMEITKREPELIRKAFEHFDRDKNGVIDIREFNQALISLGVNLKEICVFALFGRYDINREGLITFPLFSQSVVGGRTPKKKNRGEDFVFDEVPDFKVDDESDEERDRTELKEIMSSWN